MSKPRLQHLSSSFYLRGFTRTGTADGFLHVLDHFNKIRYKAKPEKVGRQKDFYTVDDPGIDPYYMEKYFSKMESFWAPVLKKVLETQRFTGGWELGVVLNFAAYLFLRSTRGRESMSNFIERTMYRSICDGTVTREDYEARRGLEIRSGATPDLWPPFEEVTDLAIKGSWRPQVSQTLQVELIMNLADPFVHPLAFKKWRLARATDKSGDFICSDSPFYWGNIEGGTNFDFSSKEVIVTVPLSRKLALLTSDDQQGTFDADKEFVAWINSNTLANSSAVYSPNETFHFIQGSDITLSTNVFKF